MTAFRFIDCTSMYRCNCKDTFDPSYTFAYRSRGALARLFPLISGTRFAAFEAPKYLCSFLGSFKSHYRSHISSFGNERF